jgi:hypothetical protein
MKLFNLQKKFVMNDIKTDNGGVTEISTSQPWVELQ